jgi:hypothetical protein
MCIHPIVARQRLGKHFLAATNTHETTKELLEMSISMQSVSYQMKVGDYIFPEIPFFFRKRCQYALCI